MSDSDFSPLMGPDGRFQPHRRAATARAARMAEPTAMPDAVADDLRLSIVKELLETIPAPAIGFDARGCVVFVNAEARDVLGLRRAVGLVAEDVLAPELLSVWQSGDDGIYHWVDVGDACYYAVCRAMAAGLGGQLIMLIPQGSPWHAMPYDPQ